MSQQKFKNNFELCSKAQAEALNSLVIITYHLNFINGKETKSSSPKSRANKF
jgi:hypothetical protein